MKNLLYGILTLSLTLAGCSSLPEPGATVALKERCMAAFTEDDYKEMIRMEVNEEMKDLQQMVDSRKVVILDGNKTGTLIQKKMERALVELQINGRPYKVWIAEEDLEGR